MLCFENDRKKKKHRSYHQAKAAHEKNIPKKTSGTIIFIKYSSLKLNFQTHSGDERNAVRSIEKILLKLCKNLANSGGSAGNTTVGKINAKTWVCVVTNATAPKAVVACVPSMLPPLVVVLFFAVGLVFFLVIVLPSAWRFFCFLDRFLLNFDVAASK